MLKQRTTYSAWIVAALLLSVWIYCLQAEVTGSLTASILLLACGLLILAGTVLNATVLKLFDRDWSVQGAINRGRDELLGLLVGAAFIALAYAIHPLGLPTLQSFAQPQPQREVEAQISGWASQ